MFQGWLLLLLLATSATAHLRRSSGRTSSSNLLPRSSPRQSFVGRAGRQLGQYGDAGAASGGGGGQSQSGGCEEPPEDGDENGVDFSGCKEDPKTGFCCVEKIECVATVKKDPILECTHKNVEQCHYTYVTIFSPSQEEVCEENFEKTCSITFNQQAYNETVRKCYTPVEKVCTGQGEQECTTVYESSCNTKYVEKSPGSFVGDTKCEKLPTKLCGAGCSFEEGPEECHDKQVVSLVESPEEICELNPKKTCRYQTKLVPKLEPKHECTIVPKETCLLKFTTAQQIRTPLMTKWCLDPTEPESNAETDVRGRDLISGSASQSYGAPALEASASSLDSYGASPAAGGYDSPDSYDYDYTSDANSVPSAGGYDAPGPADLGYSAPTSGSGDYSSVTEEYGFPASQDESYSSPSRRRSKKLRGQQESKSIRSLRNFNSIELAQL